MLNVPLRYEKCYKFSLRYNMVIKSNSTQQRVYPINCDSSIFNVNQDKPINTNK